MDYHDIPQKNHMECFDILSAKNRHLIPKTYFKLEQTARGFIWKIEYAVVSLLKRGHREQKNHGEGAAGRREGGGGDMR